MVRTCGGVERPLYASVKEKLGNCRLVPFIDGTSQLPLAAHEISAVIGPDFLWNALLAMKRRMIF